MSNHHSWKMRITLESDVTRILECVTSVVSRISSSECGEFGQVLSINSHSFHHFALSTRLNQHYCGTQVPHNPFEWKSIQAGLITHSHHNQSLSNTTRGLYWNALPPKTSDLREGMSSHHALLTKHTPQLQ